MCTFGDVSFFDIDVSLAELSYILDVRLSMLTVSSFLAYFFQSVYLFNRDRHGGAVELTNAAGVSDLFALPSQCVLCVWILLTCSGVNQVFQRLRLVAMRFAAFQERGRGSTHRSSSTSSLASKRRTTAAVRTKTTGPSV